MSANRQTLSFLQRRFQEAGIRPEVRHGQNFLIDLNLIDVLVEAARPGPNDVVLEVGTGMGSLTAKLAERAAHVVTVEIDHRMHSLAAEELENFSNITMLLQDALKNKNHLHPGVLEAVREQLNAAPDRRFKLAANLPYNVATPILSNLLTSDPSPVSLTATIQKELADRITAPPGTKDYSALSIWMQALCEVDIIRILPPQVFWPRPKVHSAIIHVIPSSEKRSRIADLTFFHDFVRSLFLHRRKFLRSGLVHMLEDRLGKPGIDATLESFGFPNDVRAEQLDVETILALSDAFRQRLQAPDL
jgi:16S rRNA (adenine1518-N6/adenine1519-N6)-dimethyltransferase